MQNQTIIAPSILAADPAHLEREIQDVEKAGADWIHIDVMDGQFVPPITFGPNIVQAAKQSTNLLLDVHLMIVEPEKHIEDFIAAGASRVIVHQETCPHLQKTLTAIRDLGASPGVAINPATPVPMLYDVLEVCDLILVMTVNPGWGGQKFIEPCLRKIETLRAELVARALSPHIEVDGGINAETAKQCRDAGANVMVAGSYIFGHANRGQAIASLRS